MKTLKLILVGISVCALIFSCEKKSAIVDKEATASTPATENVSAGGNVRLTSITTPENSSNPVDSFGVLHNEVVDYLFVNASPIITDRETSLQYIEDNYGTAVRDQTQTAMNTFLQGPGRPGSSGPTPGSLYGNAVNGFTVQSFKTCINGLPVSGSSKTFLNQLVDIMTDSTTHDIADYDVVKGLIINWENAVIASGLTGQARDRLLGAGAVARHSMYYWQVYDDANIPPDGTSIAARGRGGFLRWLGWGLVGAADAIGFFVGGGGLSGVVVGGAGSYLGFKIFKARGWRP